MAGTVPFATADMAGEVYPQDHHLISRKTGVTDKAGKEVFDQAVYVANRAANAQNLAHSKAHNHSSAGGGAPYSLHNCQPTDAYETKDFHMQHTHKDLPDKIGTSGTFDADTYRQSLEANQALQQQLKQKKHGSAATEGGSGGNSGSSCPFATFSSAECREQWTRNNYQAKGQAKNMAEKVGTDKTFDPALYSAALKSNMQQQAESLQRSYVGSGQILAFHPGGLPPQ